MRMTLLLAVRDLALAAGGAALAAMTVTELADRRTAHPVPTPGRPAAPARPGVRHGWLFLADYSGEPARLRPASAAEAAASRASRSAGHGGYIGLTAAGEVLAPSDPAYVAGAGRWTTEHGRIDTVYVDGAPAPAGRASTGALVVPDLLAETDDLLATVDAVLAATDTGR
ncbi:hypothetical protein [Pseudofrankia inefficax]|uniref:Secreted protein n=1 Tax=Pseudofrankia inefficax (strain DSM 45817 / CECT 9037 / DDB 130130 / EuI1c) TaxID=298654 RepID=E3IX44_PSEI1|nr:hypothetical protein [Pseudofrankia inefficax]ADP83816.1 hypothetical protein FraEuI1c_5832 [Pseudofrankia inefficax]